MEDYDRYNGREDIFTDTLARTTLTGGSLLCGSNVINLIVNYQSSKEKEKVHDQISANPQIYELASLVGIDQNVVASSIQQTKDSYHREQINAIGTGAFNGVATLFLLTLLIGYKKLTKIDPKL